MHLSSLNRGLRSRRADQGDPCASTGDGVRGLAANLPARPFASEMGNQLAWSFQFLAGARSISFPSHSIEENTVSERERLLAPSAECGLLWTSFSPSPPSLSVFTRGT